MPDETYDVMTDKPIFVMPPDEPMMHYISEVTETLLDGGMVEAGKLVYLPSIKHLGFEVQTSGGHWLATVRTKAADASKVPQGGLVEIDADAKAKANTPYTQDGVMQGLLLVLQYMTHKAHIRKDSRFEEAASRWEESSQEDRAAYRPIN